MKSLAKPHRLVVALMLALIGPSIDAADTAEVEARLSALESRWDQMEAELAAIRALVQNAAPAPSADLPAAVGAVSKTVDGLGADLAEVRAEVESQSQALAAVGAARQRDIAISSYGAVNFGKRSGQDAIIDAESFELVLSGQPHERISFFSEIEFERAASVGAERGGEVLLEQAYVDLAWNESLALRAGVILVPFGNNEADHYAPLRDVIARPLSSRLIAPSDWTDNAFGLVGHHELSADWQLDWEAYLVAGLDDGIDAGGLRNARQGFGEDNNNDKALAAHLTLRRNDQLRSASASTTATTTTRAAWACAGWAWTSTGVTSAGASAANTCGCAPNAPKANPPTCAAAMRAPPTMCSSGCRWPGATKPSPTRA